MDPHTPDAGSAALSASAPRCRKWFALVREGDEGSVVMEEIAAGVRHPWPNQVAPTTSEQQLRLGAIFAVISAASQGKLEHLDTWKPVSPSPKVWEIRTAWRIPPAIVSELRAERRRRTEIPKPGPKPANPHAPQPPILDEMHWRGYFHEPAARPSETVLACAHIKEILECDEKTNAAQDVFIDRACERVDLEAGHCWGLDDGAPEFPLIDPTGGQA